MTRFVVVRLVAAAFAMFVVSGCGDDEGGGTSAPTPATAPAAAGLEGQTEATAVLEKFLGALVAEDGARACGLLSPRGVSVVEEGALIGSPPGGGPCADVVVASFGSPEDGVAAGLRVVNAERSTDGSLRLTWENADSAAIGAPTVAVLRKEGGAWRLDSTGMP
jgi:hypothetical protein